MNITYFRERNCKKGLAIFDETESHIALNIYLLPGLGADERLFQYLDLGEHSVVPIKWWRPKNSEPIEEYAARISSQINGSDSILIGVSFGGMMAIEIGKIIQTEKIILVSSAATYRELPIIYRWAGRLKLHRLFTGGLLKRSHRMLNWMMGAGDTLRKTLLADMLRDTDKDFLFWAMDKIVTWNNEKVPDNVIRIHGDRDRVLPLRKTDYLIKNGGHIMVANRAEEVTSAIRTILSSGR